MADRHPSTRFRYLHVIPDHPSYREIFYSYENASASLGWMKVISPSAWAAVQADLAGSPDLGVIVWGHTALVEPVKHAGLLAGFYTEVIGSKEEFGDPTASRLGILEKYVKFSGNFDLLFAATPAGQKRLQTLCPERCVHLTAAGYDPIIMGRPSWDAQKNIDLAYYGATTNRRTEIMPALRQSLEHAVSDISGSYGFPRQLLLNLSKAVLHLHSWPKATCSTSRIWQSIASSAAMIMEATDAWPAVSGRHYIEIPMVTPSNITDVAVMIDKVLEDPRRLLEIARTAHEELSVYTPEYVMENYFIPAIHGEIAHA